MKHETSAGIACVGILFVLAIVFGIDAGLAEILHLVFPSVLSFWKWFGLIVVASSLMGAIGGRRNNA